MPSSMVLVSLFMAMLLAILVSVHYVEATAPMAKRNLLFIIGESMRNDDFEAYFGIKDAAPSFHQRLFQRSGSVVVDQFHVDYPMCNPSRSAILLGRSPDVTMVKTNFASWRDHPAAKSWRSLPTFLKDHGWYTMSGGKVFHRGTNDRKAWDRVFDPSDDINEAQCSRDRKSRAVPLDDKTSLPGTVGCRTSSVDIPDLIMAHRAASELSRFSRAKAKGNIPADKPFCMFVGFHIPHTPIRVNHRFVLPKQSLTSLIPLEEPPRIAEEFSGSLLSFDSPKPINDPSKDDPDRSPIPAEIKRGNTFIGSGPLQAHRLSLRWLHTSGVRQTDEAFKRIMDALDTNGFTANTLIVFVSDHSVALGDTRLFEKDLPLDIATRVPFVMNLPWMDTSPAVHTGRGFFMTGIDIYRTVAGVLGLGDFVDDSVNGRDFSLYFQSLLQRQTGRSDLPPSKVAISQVVRCSNPIQCRGNLEGFDLVGYTARTEQYRYVVYLRAFNGRAINFTRENIVAEELYDHSNDYETIFNPSAASFSSHEFHNVVGTHPEIADNMLQVIAREMELLSAIAETTQPSSSPSATTITPPPTTITTTPPPTRPPTLTNPPLTPTPRPSLASRRPSSEMPTTHPTYGDSFPSVAPAQPSLRPTASDGSASTANPQSLGSIGAHSENGSQAYIAAIVIVPLFVLGGLFGVWFVRRRRRVGSGFKQRGTVVNNRRRSSLTSGSSGIPNNHEPGWDLPDDGKDDDEDARTANDGEAIVAERHTEWQ